MKATTPGDHEFREEVRTWLAENVPAEPQPVAIQEMREFDLNWQRTQYDGGWAGISWPAEYGGRGMTLTQQLIWYEEYALANGPDVGVNFVGLNHGGPTLIARGDDAQKSFHLPRILRGEAVWCQGFSEPEAGSDLASLRTRAVLDGDELVVTGQKIWTSYADAADYQELLVRTDSTGSKHQGITWVIADMRAPGIEVRPLRTPARDRHFAEVFYDDVRIPLSNVVGALDQGWSVAMSTLGFERGSAFMADQLALHRRLEQLIELAGEVTGPDGRRPALADDEIARRLADARAEVAALRAMTYAAVSRNARRPTPGPEGSIVKLYFAEIRQSLLRLTMDVLGPRGLTFVHRHEPDGHTGAYLYSLAASIGGGTSEVQRTIIGERVLGLPR
ncbi:acyl-CoA dehydrogenase family protein [Amycolatopsis acidiphila]|uniref:Acyl-CoA dehydrogenase n=1 Tax=Amycolatopsis acidiphila TaxID=715473 RepID=A0A558AB33_9PSEU|nr:acyl-CoA dehydrogenase family protein [Amycolatopsis acidiphila]TVT21444.1 acyl-CoA dehydrogenase [Amycolatopsis acidiphila]UIJ63118.1 acyl-CoA dehydrogenase family protein [Amycolatopsis acidiphila]GHG73825.1 acyl-CoA dehydrogenase [Amycolatopsis acidiphila]